MRKKKNKEKIMIQKNKKLESCRYNVYEMYVHIYFKTINNLIIKIRILRNVKRIGNKLN